MTITVGKLLALVAALAIATGTAIAFISHLDGHDPNPSRSSEPRGSSTNPVEAIQKEAAGSELPTACTIHRAETNLSVRVFGVAADSECASLAQKWSSSDAYWQSGPSTGTFSGSAFPVCDDGLDNGHPYALTIKDTGDAIYGNELCGTMAGAGMWP